MEFLGIGTTVGFFKVLRDPILQKTLGEIVKVYPHFSFNQFYCLTCRSAMYLYSILLCKKLGIDKICEGARKSQLFAIEQESMIHKYRELLKEYDITLFTPILELEDDYEREIELLMRGIEPIVYESQCYLGTPMKRPLTKEEEQDIVSVYENELKPKCYQLIKRSDKIDLNLKGKLF